MKLRYFLYGVYWVLLTPFIFYTVHNILTLRDKVARNEILDNLQHKCEDKVMDNMKIDFIRAHVFCQNKIKREFPNE